MADSSGVDKKKYKLLKQGFREERELRINIEHELEHQIAKVESVSKELELQKERNIDLYE